MDYEELLETVRQLIIDTGRTVTFEKLSPTAIDPAKPWKGPGVPTVLASQVTIATFVPPAGTDLGRSFIDEELLKRADQVCLVAPHEAFNIEEANRVQDGGTSWRVEWIQMLKPGNVVMLLAVGVCQ